MGLPRSPVVLGRLQIAQSIPGFASPWYNSCLVLIGESSFFSLCVVYIARLFALATYVASFDAHHSNQITSLAQTAQLGYGIISSKSIQSLNLKTCSQWLAAGCITCMLSTGRRLHALYCFSSTDSLWDFMQFFSTGWWRVGHGLDPSGPSVEWVDWIGLGWMTVFSWYLITSILTY